MSGPDSILLERIERIGRVREEYRALCLHLSLLQPYNHLPSYLDFAGHMARSMSRSMGAESFQLPNDDIVVIGRGISLSDLEPVAGTIRALFSHDPLAFQDSGDGRDQFYSRYDLAVSFETFKADVAASVGAGSSANRQHPKEVIPPFDPLTLDSVMGTIDGFDLSPVIRRQAALRFDRHDQSAIAFQEYFVSMSDLPQALNQTVNMTSNRWLFLYLSAELDRTMLDWFSDVRLRRKRNAISLNLNMESLFTPAFQSFETRLKTADLSLIVELQTADVFADLSAYFLARDWLHERGHEILLDGVRLTTIQMADIGALDTDLIKLLWSPRLAEPRYGEAAIDAIQSLGIEKIVLAHCDSEQAVQWGTDAGISCFQGNFVDTMLGALTMSACEGKEFCTLQQCTMRRSLMAGRARLECEDIDRLDSMPSLRAFSEKKTFASETT